MLTLATAAQTKENAPASYYLYAVEQLTTIQDKELNSSK
jgi:hypothetical protein